MEDDLTETTYYPPQKTITQRHNIHSLTPNNPLSWLSSPIASPSNHSYKGLTCVTIKKPHPFQYQREEEGKDNWVDYDFYNAHDEVAKHNMDT